jgi:hypothetical protein
MMVPIVVTLLGIVIDVSPESKKEAAPNSVVNYDNHDDDDGDNSNNDVC